jgi:hypothetical protein
MIINRTPTTLSVNQIIEGKKGPFGPPKNNVVKTDAVAMAAANSPK